MTPTTYPPIVPGGTTPAGRRHPDPTRVVVQPREPQRPKPAHTLRVGVDLVVTGMTMGNASLDPVKIAVAEILSGLGQDDKARLIIESEFRRAGDDQTEQVEQLTEQLAEQERETERAESESDKLRKCVTELTKSLGDAQAYAHNVASGHEGPPDKCKRPTCATWLKQIDKHSITKG